MGIRKVVLNDMISHAIPQSYKQRDVKSLQVQSAMQVATMPLVAIVDGLKSGELKDKPDRVVQMAFSSLSMLSSANQQLNQVRRDNIRPALSSRYRAICTEPLKPSGSLFGEDLPSRLKQAQTAAALSQSIGLQSQKKGQHNHGGPHRGRGRGYARHTPYPTFGMYGAYGNYGYPGKGSRKAKGEKCSKDLDRIFFTEDSDFSKDLGGEGLSQTELIDDVCLSSTEREVREEVLIPLCGEEEDRVDSPAPEPEKPLEQVSVDKIPMDIWGDKYEAGRVALCEDYWSQITSDPVILGYVRGVQLDFEDLPDQSTPMPEVRFSVAEREFVRKEILSLLEKKVISKVEHVTGEFISNIFIVEKSEPGKYRLILNLKRLNKYLKKCHFKMDSLANAISLIVPGCFFHSFDFSDAYYAIRVAPNHRKYLRFYFEGQLYEYSVIPNGVSSGPRIFTKLMKVCLAFLRKEHDISISGFLDDQIMCHYNGIEDSMSKGKIAAIHFQKMWFYH